MNKVIVQSKDIIEVLENSEARSFINDHINGDLASLSLKYQGKCSFNITVCLHLMAIYKKAKKKLPSYWQHKLALDARSYEQSSSEAVANYKRSFIKGEMLLDITGGLGVDAMILSKNFSKTIVVESNEELHKLASFNAAKLESNLVRVLGDGVDELAKREVTWLYIDPDRRSDAKRTVDLEFLKPNVLSFMSLIEQRAACCYIKLSPLYDIKEAFRVFSNLREIHLIAENNEMKEVGLVLSRSLDVEQRVHLVDVKSGFSKSLVWSSLDGSVQSSTYVNEPYFHIAIAIVSKASAAHMLTSEGVRKHPEFELFYSSVKQKEGFRNFEVCYHGSLSAKVLKKNLSALGIQKLNIILKGTKESAQIWHKKIGTRDGGAYYGIFCLGKKKEAFIVKLIS